MDPFHSLVCTTIDNKQKLTVQERSLLEHMDKAALYQLQRLASSLAKLNIEVDPTQLFDLNISSNILQALNKTYCQLGSQRIKHDIETAETVLHELNSLKSQLEEFHHSMQTSFGLNTEEEQKKLSTIKQFETQLKTMNEKHAPSTGLHSNDVDATLQNKFLINERTKNEQLKEEIQQLENDFPCFANITTDAELEAKIAQLEREKKQMLFFNDTPSSYI